ncbi:MAG: heme-binding domain-containing protein [Ignavibacteria bacterium]
MGNFLRGILLLVIFGVIILQFIKPETVNPVENRTKLITLNLQVPENVQRKLEESCYDCHSYRTDWQWYSEISPIVYLIKNDVEEGREHLNFSLWADYDKQEMVDLLDEIEKTVKKGEMPLTMYTLLHPSARLSDEEAELITEWAQNSKRILSK